MGFAEELGTIASKVQGMPTARVLACLGLDHQPPVCFGSECDTREAPTPAANETELPAVLCSAVPDALVTVEDGDRAADSTRSDSNRKDDKNDPAGNGHGALLSRLAAFTRWWATTENPVRAVFLSRELVAAAEFDGVRKALARARREPGAQVHGGVTARLIVDPQRFVPAEIEEGDPIWEGRMLQVTAVEGGPGPGSGSGSNAAKGPSSGAGASDPDDDGDPGAAGSTGLLSAMTEEVGKLLPRAQVTRNEKRRMMASSQTRAGTQKTSLARSRGFAQQGAGAARTRAARVALRRWDAFRRWYQARERSGLRRWHLRSRLALELLRLRGQYELVASLRGFDLLQRFTNVPLPKAAAELIARASGNGTAGKEQSSKPGKGITKKNKRKKKKSASKSREIDGSGDGSINAMDLLLPPKEVREAKEQLSKIPRALQCTLKGYCVAPEWSQKLLGCVKGIALDGVPDRIPEALHGQVPAPGAGISQEGSPESGTVASAVFGNSLNAEKSAGGASASGSDGRSRTDPGPDSEPATLWPGLAFCISAESRRCVAAGLEGEIFFGKEAMKGLSDALAAASSLGKWRGAAVAAMLAMPDSDPEPEPELVLADQAISA